jgi:hypothetical protein
MPKLHVTASFPCFPLQKAPSKNKHRQSALAHCLLQNNPPSKQRGIHPFLRTFFTAYCPNLNSNLTKHAQYKKSARLSKISGTSLPTGIGIDKGQRVCLQ